MMLYNRPVSALRATEEQYDGAWGVRASVLGSARVVVDIC